MPTAVLVWPKRVESATPAAIAPHVPTESSNASGHSLNQGLWEQQGEMCRVPDNLSAETFLRGLGSHAVGKREMQEEFLVYSGALCCLGSHT